MASCGFLMVDHASFIKATKGNKIKELRTAPNAESRVKSTVLFSQKLGIKCNTQAPFIFFCFVAFMEKIWNYYALK